MQNTINDNDDEKNNEIKSLHFNITEITALVDQKNGIIQELQNELEEKESQIFDLQLDIEKINNDYQQLSESQNNLINQLNTITEEKAIHTGEAGSSTVDFNPYSTEELPEPLNQNNNISVNNGYTKIKYGSDAEYDISSDVNIAEKEEEGGAVVDQPSSMVAMHGTIDAQEMRITDLTIDLEEKTALVLQLQLALQSKEEELGEKEVEISEVLEGVRLMQRECDDLRERNESLSVRVLTSSVSMVDATDGGESRHSAWRKAGISNGNENPRHGNCEWMESVVSHRTA